MPSRPGAPDSRAMGSATARGPERHLALAAQQALQREPAEHLVDRALHVAQHRADRAVAQVRAGRRRARVLLAEARVEEAAAQRPPARRPPRSRRPGAPACSRRPGRACCVTKPPRRRTRRILADVGGSRCPRARSARRSSGSRRARAICSRQRRPYSSCVEQLSHQPELQARRLGHAALVPGGSSDDLDVGLVTPGSAAILPSMSRRRTSPMPQPGAVSVNCTDDLAGRPRPSAPRRTSRRGRGRRCSPGSPGRSRS